MFILISEFSEKFVCFFLSLSSKSDFVSNLIANFCYKSVFPFSVACSAGFYKAKSSDIGCSKCPPHSHSLRDGANVCDCHSGFFRADADPPSMACTRKNSASDMHKQLMQNRKQFVSMRACAFLTNKKKNSHCSPTVYLFLTEGDRNMSECHPCFMISLLMTKPPSTSCLVVITEGTKK